MNKVFLIGRLTRDPELRYIPSGDAVATFGIAVDRPFKNSSGEKEVDFLNCVAWRKTGELVCQYLQKGSQVAIDGRLQSRSWEGSDGKRQYRTEVVAERVEFLSRSKKQEEAPTEEPEPTPEDESVPF